MPGAMCIDRCQARLLRKGQTGVKRLADGNLGIQLEHIRDSHILTFRLPVVFIINKILSDLF